MTNFNKSKNLKKENLDDLDSLCEECKKNDESVIVELKASKNKNIDDLFEEFPFQEIRFSKYCNGVELFNRN